MSRRIYRSQYLEDYDDDEYEIVYKSKPKPKYVYATNTADQYYVINGKYYKKVNSERPNLTYLDDEDELAEEKIIYKSRRKSPEIMYLVENDRDYYTEEEEEEEQQYITPRVYAPPKTKAIPKTKSLDYIPSSESIFTAKAKNSFPTNKKGLHFKKPNHRKEIEEPKIRDKPTFNKPVIFGGAIIHK